MRFTYFGGFVQMQRGTEGNALRRVGLIDVRETDFHTYVTPTTLLSGMFSSDPPMEELYPVMVEYVMKFRFPELVNVRDVERRLYKLGMTQKGLERFELMLGVHYGWWGD